MSLSAERPKRLATRPTACRIPELWQRWHGFAPIAGREVRDRCLACNPTPLPMWPNDCSHRRALASGDLEGNYYGRPNRLVSPDSSVTTAQENPCRVPSCNTQPCSATQRRAIASGLHQGALAYTLRGSRSHRSRNLVAWKISALTLEDWRPSEVLPPRTRSAHRTAGPFRSRHIGDNRSASGRVSGWQRGVGEPFTNWS